MSQHNFSYRAFIYESEGGEENEVLFDYQASEGSEDEDEALASSTSSKGEDEDEVLID